jgi:hypothetical protein
MSAAKNKKKAKDNAMAVDGDLLFSNAYRS